MSTVGRPDNAECRGLRTIFDALATFARDEAERHALQDRFLHLQRLETMGRLASGVAHDFNNLLTIVRCYSEFIIGRSPDGDQRRCDAEEIRRAADSAAILTRQLLVWNRHSPRFLEVIDLNSVVRDFEQMLVRIIGEDVRLDLTLADEPCAVYADRGEIHQVLMNLAANARDAMPDGGTLTIEMAHEGATAAGRGGKSGDIGAHARLSVSDTGEGIPHEVQPRIFEPFFTTKTAAYGTGLGLATVHGIVTQSGGRVRVRSEAGAGATFDVLLPCISSSELAVEELVDERELSGMETILVVEDDPYLRESVRRALEELGYEPLVAASGADAVRVARSYSGRIDAVITDVIMPGMSGAACVARIEAIRPDIRVLYMSGYTDDRIEAHGLLRDEAAFLRKPFAPAELARALRDVLG